MSRISELLPEDRQLWLRAFYGFNPEEAGYLGFTYKKTRAKVADEMREGDLVLIYGALNDLTDHTLRQQALGFWKYHKSSAQT